MKVELAITDLTRMYHGRVCIAGYDKYRHCYRPILPPPGIPGSSLIQEGHAVIFPSAVVEFDFLQPDPKPPHSEDYFFDPASPRFIRRVKNWETVLGWSLFNSVDQVFDQPIYDDLGFYVMDCQGSRSIGTVRPSSITKAIYAEGSEGSWDYRLMFTDNLGKPYRLRITDMTWHYFCDSLREKGQEPPEIASLLTGLLRSRKVYLRIGLARGWKKFPGRCYLQINGVFTFPDYLDGMIFTDFLSKGQALREIREPSEGYEVTP
jgi:hypothetical protein